MKLYIFVYYIYVVGIFPHCLGVWNPIDHMQLSSYVFCRYHYEVLYFYSANTFYKTITYLWEAELGS